MLEVYLKRINLNYDSSNVNTMNISDIRDLTAIALIGLFIILVVKPLLSVLISRLQGNINNNNYTKLDARMNKLETNHLIDINRRLLNLETKQDKFQEELEKIKIEIVKIK